MRLTDVVAAPRPPQPWAEGDNIPWHEPGFSRRMLREHLSQAHDAASRRSGIIDEHVAWIHGHVLQEQPSRVLDLGCGPGLYTQRLARLGHQCEGIDYSPASVEYAREAAAAEGLTVEYKFGDMRHTPYGREYDLVMLLYGDFNVFSPGDGELVLRQCREALKPGGTLLLEPNTLAGVKAIAAGARDWSGAKAGLFGDNPHLLLEETFWDEPSRAATTRYFVIQAETGEVERYAASYQAYAQEEYAALLERCGFSEVRFLDGLGSHRQEGLQVILAVK